jgi:phosphogluconate dehydratase
MIMSAFDTIRRVTDRILERSRDTRSAYEATVAEALSEDGPRRQSMPCANIAHVGAACCPGDKQAILGTTAPNLGIVTAYNDMVSAHQPFEDFPTIIRTAAAKLGAVAQVAGGVPAMCDGITQGRDGMELSLFSRDVIAMSTAIALSHDAFDAGLYLGTCDKIVPGLFMGAVAFGHLPAIFVPSGPMTTGLSNEEKVKVRQLYAEGKVKRDALLESETRSYHAKGTCTFYGTANSNQMLMEIMGLHLPGSTFVNPDTPLRDALTRAAVKRAVDLSLLGKEPTPIADIVTAKSVVNGIVGLLATGGSTNHTMHMVAMARAAGIIVTWDDFSELSDAVPLIARVYPNGPADVNQFHAAGGMRALIDTLLVHRLVHADVRTVVGDCLEDYIAKPKLIEDEVVWQVPAQPVVNPAVIKTADKPFQANGGLKVLTGNIGRAIIKISSLKKDQFIIEAPARIFERQQDLITAFERGELNRDFVAILRFQGPKASGMPELHKLSSALGVLQDRGFKVALVTDGRMSGASGKIPAAIHITPEAVEGGMIARIDEGDIVVLDAIAGTLSVRVDEDQLAQRKAASSTATTRGTGRELFLHARERVSGAEAGASFVV